MNDPSRRKADRETRAVYGKADALWAPYSCPGSSECCQLKVTQRQPWLWPSEWRVLVGAGPLPAARPDGACPFLDANSRCSRYADRPLGCRTFFCHRIRGPQAQPVHEMNTLLERMARVNLQSDEHAEPRPLLELHARGQP